MGAKSSGDRLTIFITIIIFTALSSSSSSQKNIDYSQDSLNSFLHSYALKAIPQPLTGHVYEVPPPANLSGGGGVSLLRLRTHRLWEHGLNLSSIQIPPAAALPSPFTARVDFFYQNLGNWSTLYYRVPNYTLVAPVIGLLAYDSGTDLARPIELEIRDGKLITVCFDNVSQYDAESLRCVWFSGGTWQLSNVRGGGSTCEGRSDGHVSIVAPLRKEEKKKAAVRWWMVGIPGGAVAVGLGGVVWWKVDRWRRERRMMRMAEKSEGLNKVWIGNSRMFTASVIRTQPNLETTYLP